MSLDSETVRVNFSQPTPIFPLSMVTLFPHAVLPLHIFESCYQRMIEDVLDRSGQIAMAVIEDDVNGDTDDLFQRLRPAVCLGQIIQHERLMDGRYNILLQGICRARILEEQPPDEDRPYRQALLEPIETLPLDESDLDMVRDRLHDLLTDEPLNQLSAAENVASCLARPEAPTAAVLELVGVSLITHDAVRYQLLEEGDPLIRAEIIELELDTLRSLLQRAEKQLDPEAPKGVSWN